MLYDCNLQMALNSKLSFPSFHLDSMVCFISRDLPILDVQRTEPKMQHSHEN